MSRINNRLAVSKNKIIALLTLFILVFLSITGPLSAQTVTQGYKTDQTLQQGVLVAVDQDDSDKVEALREESLDRARGVVVQRDDSPIVLSSDASKVLVASSGEFDVLVNDQNGQVEKGDYLSVSSTEGIGMKATADQATVVGRVLEDFQSGDDITGVAADVDASDTRRVKTSIAIGSNPSLRQSEKRNLPGFLSSVGETIADKPVSTFRIYISLALFLATITVVGFMLYGGVRSSLISMGRNPLSRKSILRGFFQVFVISILIFIVGMFGVYLLLKL